VTRGAGDPASGPRDGGGPEPAPADGAHQENGLELARSIARSLARGAPGRTRRSRPRRPDPQSSGAHPDDRDPQPLDATIGRLVAEQGWGTDVRVHGVFSRWDAIVGRDVAQHVRPVGFTRETDGGRLLVSAGSTRSSATARWR
jgi:predicted nucleic acid-binding Zn ribbon protein